MTKGPSGSKKMLFGREVYRSPMSILNASIKELSNRNVDIQKIAIFEDPPQAILHIKESNPPKSKLSWLYKFKKIKPQDDSLTRVKLYVNQMPGSKSPFRLNYEFVKPEGHSK